MASPESAITANIPSPILNIDDNLLWRIFSVVADMDGYDDENTRSSALLMVIRTSQVCHHWREAILGSTSLWGRVVDIDFLMQLHPVRRNDILQRTGESYIHLKCSRACGVLEARAFLISLLDNYWTRLRVVDLNLYERDTQFITTMWRLLQRPTPFLEVCRLSTNDSQYIVGPKLKLFTNNAPSLREFRSDSIVFDLKSTWMSQLRRLEISRYFSLQVSELRAALNRMPCLEYLSLDNNLDAATKIQSVSTPIDLPNLHTIVISGRMGPCATIFLEIRPRPYCFVYFSSVDQRTTNYGANLTRRALRNYSKNYFLYNIATSLTLLVSSRTFQFADESSNFRSFGFNIKIYQLRPSLKGAKMSKILGSLLTCNFSKVTNLVLKYVPFAVLPTDPTFRAFIMALPSVTIMKTTEETIVALLSIPGNYHVFPRLLTLNIDTMMNDKVQNASYRTPIVDFISRKWKLGDHLENLDIWSSFGYEKDMRLLETMKGLKVRWNIRCELGSDNYREYICGSGQSEQLNIRCTSETWI